mgnify:CR=1 FL=1
MLDVTMTVTGPVQSHPPLASIASCKKPLLSSCWYWIFSSHTILTTGFPGWYLYSWAICWLHVLTLKLWTSAGQWSVSTTSSYDYLCDYGFLNHCLPHIFSTIFVQQANEYIESEKKFSCHQLALMSLIPCKFLTISCKIDYIHYPQDIFLWCGYKVMTPNHGLVRQESKVVTVTGFLLWCDSLVRV